MDAVVIDKDVKCVACNKNAAEHDTYVEKQRRPSLFSDHFIQCDHCESWLHIMCAGVQPYEVDLIDQFSCKKCVPQHGRFTVKEWKYGHRREPWDPDGVDKPMEVGTKMWIEEFIKTEEGRFRPPPAELVRVCADGNEFARVFDPTKEWTKIFLIRDRNGLGMKMPEPGTFNFAGVCEVLGNDYYVSVIDVYRQLSSKMSLGRLRSLLDDHQGRRYNMLSLEFTGTKLSDLVQYPAVVGELSWSTQFFPFKQYKSVRGYDNLKKHTFAQDSSVSVEYLADKKHLHLRPTVEMYCLAGMEGSYTDFHIDFGGSSVWYHIYHGKKIFYVVEPTERNLQIYEEWQKSANQEEVFVGAAFGEECYRVEVEQGNTLMIPSGWIHAVYTPVQSLVFGGNFLSFPSIINQYKVYDIEMRTHVDQNYQYPNFETSSWYAARYMVKKLKDADKRPDEFMMRSVEAMLKAHQCWIDRDLAHDEKKSDRQKGPNKQFIAKQSQVTILEQLRTQFMRVQELVKQTDAGEGEDENGPPSKRLRAE